MKSKCTVGMTEKEMRERIDRINIEISKLREERKEYEDYFHDKEENKKYMQQKDYIGKCFAQINGCSGCSIQYIKAFKIIDVLKEPNENYALCICLIDGSRKSRFREFGIQIMTLNLWSYNALMLMNKPDDPKVIDFYKEISQEEFDKMNNKWNQKIVDMLKF